MSGVGTAIAVGAAVSAAGSVASGVIGAHGAESAAKTQAQSAQTAQQIQQQEWNAQQANEAPFVQAGKGALNNLSNLVNNPSFSQYPGGAFKAPTLEEARATPGYQFQLQTGTDALTKNAAATGNLMSGTTGTALEQYGQGLADSTYNQDYQRALNTYMTNYGVWNADTSNQVNRLQTLANTGASAAANVGAQGQAAAQNLGNLAVGQGTALASGTVGATNAINSGISGITNAASELPLYQLLAQQANQSSYAGIPMVG